MWTPADAPEARSPNAQVSVLPLIEQPWTAGSTAQTIPAPVGSGSESVTSLAIPGPLLPTVIVNPIGSPALTLAASATLSIDRFGHWTAIEAPSCVELPF